MGSCLYVAWLRICTLDNIITSSSRSWTCNHQESICLGVLINRTTENNTSPPPCVFIHLWYPQNKVGQWLPFAYINTALAGQLKTISIDYTCWILIYPVNNCTVSDSEFTRATDTDLASNASKHKLKIVIRSTVVLVPLRATIYRERQHRCTNLD